MLLLMVIMNQLMLVTEEMVLMMLALIVKRAICLRRSVRSCSHTIPEKVRNSRPINMGFKGWE